MTEGYSPKPDTLEFGVSTQTQSATQGLFTGAPSVSGFTEAPTASGLTGVPSVPGFTGVPSVSEAFTTAHPIGSHFEDEGSNSIILIGVILATLLVFLCMALVFRYMLKHKGSYRTHEDKESDWGDSANAALKSGHSFEEDLDEDV
ncbi:glycophorin-C [Clupea harengus]|uniref:Glycophorin-C n=1 Tax=Clupea harengus TaxID=7950 RepID=A0A6P8EQQ3_CLUHA|nr:glycophorin-C [Clupea harengus]XP_031414260.1 glycophorin-C [Clupea harengus]